MKKTWKYILLVPGIVLLITFLLIPLVAMIFPTFNSNGSISFQQYIGYFKDDYFVKILVRTLRVAVISSLICMILGIPTAYFISMSSKKIRGLLMALAIFPTLTNAVVRSFAWMSILGKNGVINKVLLNLGVINQPLNILYTEQAMIIGTIYIFLPLMIISLVGVMENINPELSEAAESLGASKLMAFFKVTFPLSIPGLIVGTVLVFTGALTAYTTPQLLGGNKNTVLVTLIYQKTMTLSDWNGSAIVATIMIVITLIVMKGINILAKRLDRRAN